jgi:hypothetical protein
VDIDAEHGSLVAAPRPPNETDMLLRDSNTGAFEVYDINHSVVRSLRFQASAGQRPGGAPSVARQWAEGRGGLGAVSLLDSEAIE